MSRQSQLPGLRSVGLLVFVILMSSAQTSLGQAAQEVWQFDFGPGKVVPNSKQVLADTIYSKETGYGFEPGASVRCFERKSGNALFSDLCTSDQPFYFSVALPEGNYLVSITFGDAENDTVTTVKAELRRLMMERVETTRRKFVTRTFAVNIRTP